MTKIFKLGAALLMLVFFTQTMNAQKFGYLNSAAVVSLMPEMKQAESTLEVTQKQYQKQGQKMVEDLKAKYTELQRKDQAGDLSRKELETESAALQAEEQKIGQYEQEMMAKIQEKRAELLNPLFEKVNTAIQAVAKEKGYQFIFDASPGSGILLYADDSQDVTELVLNKLGIEMPEMAPEPAKE